MTNEQKLRDYLKRVTAELNAARDELRQVAEARREPIAVVSMSCRFPGGVGSPEDLWRLVAGGGEAIGPPPADRFWDLAGLYDPDPDKPGTIHSRAGGFLDGVADFDADFFGIAPREAIAMDPQQRLLLEGAWETLERAAIRPESLRGSKTGVYVGTNGQDYAGLAASGSHEGHALTGGAAAVLAGRVAYVLGLEGPAIALDTACSSSLVAVHYAVRALRAGECSLALAGGVTIMATPQTLIEFSRQHGLSPDGRCRAFAESADGTGFAEGSGMLLLERLSDAVANGHPVLAVVRGSAINSDGASNGLSAPSGRAQQQVIRAALADAGLSASDVDVVEAHGTGTSLGDPIEARALLATYGQAHDHDSPLWLGTVKSNIGHTQAAAGVAGLIKMVQALRHGELPRTLHVDEPTPHVDWSSGGVRLLTEPVRLPPGKRPYRAGLSGFGISGTNAHVIIEQVPAPDEPPAQATADLPVVPWVLSARTESALREQAARLRDAVSERTEVRPLDVAWSLAGTRSRFERRAAVIGRDRDELVAGLEALASGEPARGSVTGSVITGRTAIVLPGQGTQRAGMGRELHGAFPAFAAAFDDVCEHMDPLLDNPLRDVVFAEAGTAMAGHLDRTDYTQSALFAFEVALYRLFESWGVTVDYLIGHSIGELVAAHIAGVWSLADACTLVATRGRLMHGLTGDGAMLAVEASEQDVLPLLAGREHEVVLAAVNGPDSVVLSGESAALAEIAEAVTAEGRKVKKLAVAQASHSPLVEPMLAEFGSAVERVRFNPPTVGLVSNESGRLVTEEVCDPAYWVRHLRAAVRFADGVHALAEAGVTRFIDLGPDGTGAAMVGNCVPDGYAMVYARRPDRPETESAISALAQAHVHGVDVDWDRFFAATGATTVDLPTYPFQHSRYWIDPPASVEHVAALGLTPAGHPWLAVAPDLADGAGHVLAGRLSLAGQPWLADHVVYGSVVLPGTGLMELALTAADWFGARGVSDLTMVAPLVLRADEALHVQVVVGPDTDGRRSVTIQSRPVAGRPTWTLHATGELGGVQADQADAGFDDLAEWPVPGAQRVCMDGFQQAISAQGIDYGPAFRATAELWRRGDSAYGLVRLPDGLSDKGFGLHPALFDGALNVMRAVAAGGWDATEAQLPFEWSSVERYALGGNELRVRIDVEPHPEGRWMTAWFSDSAGKPVARVGRLDLRAARAERMRLAAAGAEDLYRVDSQPVSPSPEVIGAELETAVVGGTGAIASILGCRHVPDLDALVAAGDFTGRIVIDATADSAVSQAAADALSTLQRLLRELRLATAELVWVTAPGMAGAAVRGLLRSARAEHSDRVVNSVEWAGDEFPAEALRVLGEPELVVSGTRWHVPRLARVVVSAPDSTTQLDPAGTVLLTGGTGKLGAAVARHLVVVHGVRGLLLTSRRGEDAPGAAELVGELIETGAERVRVVACDVTDREAVADLLSTVEQEHPLTAVFHLAGVLDDGLVLDQDTDRMERVLAPKVTGAMLLDELTRSLPLAKFILFSGIAGTLGTAGQSVYAAANSAMDALALRRHEAGLAATSLAWGLWQPDGTGMTGNLGPAEVARLGRQGIRPLSLEHGLLLLDVALRCEEPNLVPVCLDLRNAEGPALLRGLARPVSRMAKAKATTDTTLRDRLLAMPAEQRREELIRMVLSDAALVLGLADSSELDRDQALAERGLDSLMTLELRLRLTERTGVRLPSTVVFDHPAATDIAGLLLTKLDLAPSALAEPSPVPSAQAQTDNPIVIVGMGCRYPGGVRSPEDLWNLVSDGTDAVTQFPADRGWDLEALFHPEAGRAGTADTRWGGFLHEAADFDPGFFGMSPREAVATDTQHRLLLEVSWEALERAGIDPASLRGSQTGVFAGVMYSDYGTLLAGGELEGYQNTGCAPSVASGRVAYTFGLHGPAITVDTACSSSLVALHLAARALRSGECSLALAGGVTVLSTPSVIVEFSRQGGLAPDGRCKSYADTADGTGWAEGVGMLVLERLSDARRNGHRVLAVVRGTAVNSDGASNGLTAPSGPAQQRVIRQALANAGLSTSDVDVVEGHGTGTTLGDPIEAQALLETYGRDRERPLLLGSIKSNIGHAQAAAGVAGIIKMVQAMRHGVVPRTLHADTPSTHVDWSAGAVRLVTDQVDWPESDRPRRAAVSGFGVSGTNAHAILEQPPSVPDTVASAEVPVALPWVLSAKTDVALRAQAARLTDFLTNTAEWRAADVSCSLATTRAGLPYRAVVVGADDRELQAGLRAIAAAEQAPGVLLGTAGRTGNPVFVFAGQGAQWVGMGRELLGSSQVFADSMAGCAAALAPYVDWLLPDVLADEVALARVDVVQPVLWAVMVSLAAVWRSFGVRPAAVIGHSQGEVAAACVAGGLSIDDGALVVARRSQAIAASLSGRGGMASVALPVDEVSVRLERFAGRLSVAAINGPSAVVVSGEVDALDELIASCTEDGARAKKLPVDYASHSVQVQQLADRLREVLAPITPRTGDVPFYSTVTGGLLDTAELDAEYWYHNLRERVEFESAVERLAAVGHGCLVEVSPHPVLSTQIEEILNGRGMSGVVTGTIRRDDGGLRRVLTSVGHLWAHGVEVDWGALFAGTGSSVVDLPTYAFQHERYWPPARARAHDAAGFGLAATRHPMLAATVELAGEPGVVLTGRLSLESHPWLADHRVMDRVLLPGTGFVELAVRAGDEVGCARLEELVLGAPLVLPERGGVRIQVRVAPAGADGRRTLTVHSRPDEGVDMPWTQHATATLVAEATIEPTDFAEVWPPRGATEIDLTGHYDLAAESGYGYGPVFQGLRAAWRRDGEVFAEVSLPDSGVDVEGFGLHPALFDAALHAILLPDFGVQPGAVPFSWQGLQLHASRATTLRVRLSKVDSTGDERVSVLAADPDGGLVVRVDALLLRPISAEMLDIPGAETDSLFTVDWIPVTVPVTGAATEVGEVVRVADPAELAEVPATVLVDVTGPAGDMVAAAHEVAGRVLALLQGWLAEDRFAGSRLVIVTRGALAGIDAAAATAWGMVRTAISEHPGRFGVLDLESDDDLALAVPHLASGDEPQLAVRAGDVCAPRLTADRSIRTAPVGDRGWRMDIVTPGTLDGLGLIPCAAAVAELAGRQVRMAISAAGLNFRDVLSVLGYHKVWDRPLGVEAAGVVVEVGPEVTGVRAGDRVMGVVPGGFGPMTVVDERRIAAVPPDWSDETAAGVPTVFLTALYGLVDISGLAAGDRVLIHAGAGGVGMAAIQLAQWLGAEVFATASESKWDTLRELGVVEDHIASSRTLEFEGAFRELTAGRGMDVVLNSLTDEFLDASIRLVAPGGRFAEMGKNDIRSAEQLPGITYRAFDVEEAGAGRIAEMFAELLVLFEQGVLRPLPVHSWDIRRVPEAFRFMSQAKHIGKIVLRIPRTWDRAKAVLITGGTGGLGRELARHLAGQGFQWLVLASRTGLAAAGARELEAELAAEGCRVQVAACDVTDPAAVTDLVTDITAHGGLTAVVHTAGVLDDGVLAKLTQEQLHTVLRPKVDAAWHLHKATRELDLAGFVVYSSATGVLGTSGQANYAAGNTFLDALCHLRRAEGLAGVSLAWGAWETPTGMTGNLSEVDHARMRRAGLPPLSVEQGMALFDAAATIDTALAVPLRVDRSALLDREDLPAIMRGIGPAGRRVAAGSAMSERGMIERLADLPPVERHEVLCDVVRGHVAVVLGFTDAEAIDPDRTFRDLGFDSLTSVELRNKLQARLGHRLPATLVFDHPTTTALVDNLLATLVPDDQPGTDSVQRALDQLDGALAAAGGDPRDALQRLEKLAWRLRKDAETADRAGPSEEDINSVPVTELFELIDENFASSQD